MRESRKHKISTGLVFGLLVLLVSTSVHAQDWEQSFTSQALASHLPYGSSRVLVVTAGQLDADTNRLQKAIISRINEIDDATAVTIPSLNGLDANDTEILSRIEKVRPDVILIIRLFDPEGGRSTAIGTFYGSDKNVVSAFALEEGRVLASRDEEASREEGSDVDGRRPIPLPKKAQSPDKKEAPPSSESPDKEKEQSPSEGVRTETADAVSSIGEENERSNKVRRDTREHGELMVTKVRHDSTRTSGTSTRIYFYRGVYKEEISPQQFLEEVGRPELIGEYEKRKELKTTLGISAIVAGIAGIGLTLGHPLASSRGGKVAMLVGGGTLFLGGVVAGVGSMTMRAFPMSASEARKHAHRHNKKLEGRPDDLSLERPAPSLDIGAGPMGGGAGFVLKATF